MKELLERFCDKMGDWDVTFKDACAKISITFPSIRDESSGKLVPMLFSFPLEVQERISNIANETVRQYIPPLDDFQLALWDNTTKFQILDRIRSKEHAIIYNGGRSFRDELRFKFRRIMKELLEHIEKGCLEGFIGHTQDCTIKFFLGKDSKFICDCNFKAYEKKLIELIASEYPHAIAESITGKNRWNYPPTNPLNDLEAAKERILKNTFANTADESGLPKIINMISMPEGKEPKKDDNDSVDKNSLNYQEELSIWRKSLLNCKVSRDQINTR